jgi:putative Ca2+/H+ antiporter (TMEM165/GDT1 family)
VLEDFLLPFVTIALAEIGDKTQLAVLCLSSKTKRHAELLGGTILAFALSSGLASLFGGMVSQYVPLGLVKAAAGLLFIAFGIKTLLEKQDGKEKCGLKNPFASAFSMIFLAEMGDKTQLGTLAFATRFNPVLVFLGSLAALALLSVLAVYAGKFIAKRVDRATISKAAGALFIIIGAAFILF